MKLDFPQDKIQYSINRAMNSVFYKKLWKNSPIELFQDISYDKFVNIPFTQKSDLRKSDPYDYLSTPISKVRRIHTSSGTKGTSTISFYSDNDLKKWSEHLARSFRFAHLQPNDIFQTIVGFGLFSGGLGFEYAAEQYGLSVIPIGMGNTSNQINFLKDFKVKAMVTISSYLPILVAEMKRKGIDPKSQMSLQSVLIGAEPFNEKIRPELEDFLGAKTYSIYGMSEVEGPGVAAECDFHTGMHLFSDSFYPEIIDPVTCELLPFGEEGELVLTTLDRECMPLIRYRTGDITSFKEGQCPCGCDYIRISNIKSRCDDMFIVKGGQYLSIPN